MHTPRFWGEPCSAGLEVLYRSTFRPRRTNWLNVGILNSAWRRRNKLLRPPRLKQNQNVLKPFKSTTKHISRVKVSTGFKFSMPAQNFSFLGLALLVEFFHKIIGKLLDRLQGAPLLVFRDFLILQ